MTTENSGRVPRAAIAELLGGTRDEIDEMAKRTGYSRFPSPEQLRGWRCVIDSAIHHLADPAPAGARKSREELLADLESARQRAIDARIEFRTPEEIRAEIERNRSATPQPEQGAGLANAVYATVREALACDCNDTEDQVCDKCQALTAIIDLEERALARQQSRVVDWPSGVLNKSDTLAVIKQHNAWRRGAEGPQTDPRMLGLALDAVIAALEGGRDGR